MQEHTYTMAAQDPSQKRRRHRSPVDKARMRSGIMAVTADLLVEKGYEGFALREVARRAGFSAGNIYLYFQNKEDLLYAVIEDGFRRFRAGLAEAAAAHRDPMERIAAMGRQYVSFGLKNAALYDVMFLKCPDYLFVERPVPGLDTLTMLQEAIREGTRAGVIRRGTIESMADAVWAMVHGIVLLSLASPLFDSERIERAIDEGIAIILHGIHPR